MNQGSDDKELKAAFAEFKELLRRESEPVGASGAPEVRLEPTFDPPPARDPRPAARALSSCYRARSTRPPTGSCDAPTGMVAPASLSSLSHRVPAYRGPRRLWSTTGATAR